MLFRINYELLSKQKYIYYYFAGQVVNCQMGTGVLGEVSFVDLTVLSFLEYYHIPFAKKKILKNGKIWNLGI